MDSAERSKNFAENKAKLLEEENEKMEEKDKLLCKQIADQQKIPKVDFSLGALIHWLVVDQELVDKLAVLGGRVKSLGHGKEVALALAFKAYDGDSDAYREFLIDVGPRNMDPYAQKLRGAFRSIGAESMTRGVHWLSTE